MADGFGRVCAVLRFAAILISLCFLAIGTGAAEFAHNAQHTREDAAAQKSSGNAPIHNDANCAVHAQLHMPVLAGGWVPLLICLGLFIAFLTELPPAFIPRPTFTCIDCRG